MNVLIISQCHKRALTETRRILDQFAERRGDRTWQTAITQAGLETLRTLLRKTARKNTAVACHWIRGKDHSELVWIVGDARQFNHRGATPTNMTTRDVLRASDEDDWHTAEEIRLLAAMAALFHDFGKASQKFQKKLKNNAMLADPYRHEWVSLRLFEAFVGTDSDEAWLQRLLEMTSGATTLCLDRLYRDGLDTQKAMPFKNRSVLVQAIGWLIVSHHRIPTPPEKGEKERVLKLLPVGITSQWCGEHAAAEKQEIQACWTMHKGLPFDSAHWQKHAQRVARGILARKSLLNQEKFFDAYVMHVARLVLMLSDHFYSGQDSHSQYGDRTFPLYANTDRRTGNFKQRLDEHLIGVEVNVSRILRTLPQLKNNLHSIGRHKGFRQRSKDRRFRWQDKAFDLAEGLREKSTQQGFFGVNMASTGCGKTLANGRIMYALANPSQGARFTVALGLRILTLQTGSAYRQRLQLSDSDLAVMVGGGAAIKTLYQRDETQHARCGSASGEALLPEWQHVHFEGSLEGPLNHWLQNDPSASRLVNAPVVTCTIDHLMPATEGTRGGRQIAPMLRLLTSDVVLDEPDDFALEDLPALTRLVNWAGLLGSRVLLSSATLPPALIQGLFDAYLAGRTHFQNNRFPKNQTHSGRDFSVCCAWFDEYGSVAGDCADAEAFLKSHQEFVDQRVQKLAITLKEDQRRKAKICDLNLPNGSENTFFTDFAQQLREQALALHTEHRLVDPVSKKRISIGLIRMANIDPLVETAKALFESGSVENTRLHLCVYHSQHPLLVRSAIEQRLDRVLTRHDEHAWWLLPDVRSVLDDNDESDQVLIVLGTAVTEVGRDHDYDWAIVEPSSMRSIIQLAGRVRRHRVGTVNTENLYLLETNLRHLRYGGNKVAFCKPGFESDSFRLKSHNLNELLQPEQWQRIDASSRISRREQEFPAQNLVDLEHHTIQQYISGTSGDKTAVLPASRWWKSHATLCGSEQLEHPFRYSRKKVRYFLLPREDGITFCRWDDHGMTEVNNLLSHCQCVCGHRISPWGVVDYQSELEAISEDTGLALEEVGIRFGFVDLMERDQGWHYHTILGFSSKH